MVAETTAACLDGTPFPFIWEDPEDAHRQWLWNGSHLPFPLKPLTVALVTAPGARRAAKRPFGEAGLQAPSYFTHQRYLHGFQYICVDQAGPAYARTNAASIRTMVSTWGGVLAVWENRCRPRIEALLEDIRKDDGTSSLTVLAESAVEALFQTQVAAAVTQSVTAPFVQICIEAFGPEGGALAWELSHGGDNLARDADQALWQIAQFAAQRPQVRTLLFSDAISDMEAFRLRPEAAAFVSEVEAFLERFGERVESWGYDTPTLREQPDRLIDLVRCTIVEQRPSPDSLARQAAGRRAALTKDLRGRIADRPDLLARFDGALAACAPYVTIRENRAHWQLVASGVMRAAIIRRGIRLAADGLLGDPEDIYYLLPDEVERVSAISVLGDELVAAIDARRWEWKRWAVVTPPETLGRGNEGGTTNAQPDFTAPMVSSLVLRGVAASRGTATGRACVVTSLEDAERLKPGQVLVCVMMAPPWTQLFAVAAAIVTDTGSVLAHSAIAAREYGIPAVAGVRTATRDSLDGAIVTVDGTNGVVRVEDELRRMAEQAP